MIKINKKIKNIFLLISIITMEGCVHPQPPKVPFDKNEVEWAAKAGTSSIKGCVSIEEFKKYHTYQNIDGTYTSYPVAGSSYEILKKAFTVDIMPESNYMNALSKKMKNYNFSLLDNFTILNDPRWVDASVMRFIPHFSCPEAGPSVCTSTGHFLFSNLPAGNWYIVVSYDRTKEDKRHTVTRQKITTIEGQTVPFISSVGAREATCTP